MRGSHKSAYRNFNTKKCRQIFNEERRTKFGGQIINQRFFINATTTNKTKQRKLPYHGDMKKIHSSFSKYNSPPSEIRQINNPYMSTIELKKIIEEQISRINVDTIIDLGCGIGAQSIYFAREFPDVQFCGLDYNANKIQKANQLASISNLTNITFKTHDVFDPNVSGVEIEDAAAVVSIHTLCCLTEFEAFFNKIHLFSPEWLVVNSLFWKGNLDVSIHIRDWDNLETDLNPDSDFNIFSKTRISNYLRNLNYNVQFRDFFPDSPIAEPADNKRGTYTINTDLNKNTQFSGPVHLPWSFLIASKATN